ncbi:MULTISPECIES: DUF1934 domain-containing protein [unclassified Clostridium]|uniref:DUF1934 domain-containing protein n=1 Tax=Clostridium sulfidigenes TaxID=318464 RepID=A0A927ZQ08_9CLOT|nr:DUF1934 domain-containing protein [Clostridium sulfidigenes]HAR87017.1 DUF1934 domain-containing protein [Clostridium sp.]HBA03797.1 DUF1934 domain-containing protein [Clostridium sp.]
MDKDAIIRVSSIQNNDEDECIEIVSPGSFFKEDDEYVATYEETELSGLGDTLTTFRIGENYFNLIREGDVNTNMEFKNGSSSSILYNTPHGGLSIKIKTNDVNIDINEAGGKVKVDYDVIIAKDQIINTKLVATINVK